jgi:4-amino-4-deoxychorismate mutase
MPASETAEAEKLLAVERARIDELDSELIRILGERVHVCISIARIKSAANIPMMQPGRLSAVRERLVAEGKSVGLRPEFVAELHGTVTRETCRIEDEVMGNTPPQADVTTAQ